jgi:hypothetical protein
MIGINGKPWLDLEHHCDVAQLSSFHSEIIRGLALAKTSPLPLYRTKNKKVIPSLNGESFEDPHEVEKKLSPDEAEWYAKLSREEKQKYLKYKGVYFTWAVTLSLVKAPSWNEKSEPIGREPTQEAKLLFPEFIKYLYGLDIFVGIGRVLLFGIDPFQPIPCHRDADPDTYTVNDEFVMLSPMPKKLFYVLDENTNEKHYVKSQAFVFHDCDLHGVDPISQFAYSVRVDGIYSEAFRKEINWGR